MLQETQIIQKLSKFRSLCECARCRAAYECNHYGARKSRIGHLCTACKRKITDLRQFTQADLLEAFHYDELTGELRHKLDTLKAQRGDLATYAHAEGYLQMAIGGKEYLAHRIIWFMKMGRFPDQVDHGDHNRTNNRWGNLSEVTPRKNQMNVGKKCNNTFGVTGVRELPSGKYCAYIMVHRKQIALGSYADLEQAILARKAAERRYGFHVNHGS